MANIRIIDNKKVLLTDDEFQLYKNLCAEYTRPNFKGEQLFADHFEVNDDGVIIFVKPPSKKYSSLEIYCFLISLMVNQHLRLAQEQQQMFLSEAKAKYQQMLDEIAKSKLELDIKLKQVEGG